MTVTTIEPAAVATAASRNLHRIVVVGGGAGGSNWSHPAGRQAGPARRTGA